MTGLYCPKCRRPTLRERHLFSANVSIDVCKECGGSWFDTGELDQTMGPLAEPHLDDLEPHRDTPFVCPRCHKTMVSFPYPRTDVRIDFCEHCRGIWLDRQELESIILKRRVMKQSGELKKRPMPRGIKGALIRFIDNAIAELTGPD